ncbi:MAG: DUF411 domain-containing protein [Pseudohongiellaceae bacterium]|nr:DUF411 domain-containing protein [Pseudohongiellaceae bacterium]
MLSLASSSIKQMAIWVLFGLTLQACQNESSSAAEPVEADTALVQLDVLKSPTCMCCSGWVDHAQENGFTAQISHPADLNGAKLRLGIKPEYQSCHTAVSNEGYVFEGHIPAKLVQQFLANPPADALGLAVPGMPVGSPGMEVGDQFQAYDVLVLNKDGSSSLFAHVASPEEQY